ncbi:MAG TPA: hypothetical protein ENI82_03740, partial [Bacteroidetes bacterium]|nr:hypothetical protein [Bacteroidota bacterium]
MNSYFWKISLIVFVFTGLLSGFIANDKPILCKDDSGYRMPVLDKNNYLNEKDCKIIIEPLINYSYRTIDIKNAGFASPFSKQDLKEGQQRHFLGTDQIGRDVLAGMIHGTTIALKIGFLTMALSLIIALIMGIYPSYFGDSGLRRNWAEIFVFTFATLIIIYFIINYSL